MLKTAFIGNDNPVDRRICQWLSQHTDLAAILWTNSLSWAQKTAPDRTARVIRRFQKRIRKYGLLRGIDEFLYYVLYTVWLARQEQAKVWAAAAGLQVRPQKPLEAVPQLMVDDIKSPGLLAYVQSLNLDAAFCVCCDVYLPRQLVAAPRLGTFLWHEGITPEYRGVYSPFWALANQDYANLGYTILKVNEKLDAGEIYVQGLATGIDPGKDWHSYIGHKAILDSLPEVEKFLKRLERNEHKPILRHGASDHFYSYPTATTLLKIALRRLWQRSASGALANQRETGASPPTRPL